MAAGLHVTGVDIVFQPRYIGDRFIRGDVLTLDPAFLRDFDFIWASPPCQALSAMKVLHNALPHLNLIPQTRELLKASGKPYVIENVEGARAHLINPIMLCGTMFDLGAEGRELQRHRLFETSFPVRRLRVGTAGARCWVSMAGMFAIEGARWGRITSAAPTCRSRSGVKRCACRGRRTRS